ncbi:hypothetical protein [Pseudomonas tohonis]|uniref:hypothetical protein n=1 Tax=Pseudomonas tohonis TaxID=2725477 RepID=UPI001F18FAE6|nr:hypothetical protein [Pseudomonas tohonis]
MGATVFIDYSKDKSLHVTLSRKASDAVEMLFDAVLREKTRVHEEVMEMLVLDQVGFVDLSKDDFNMVVAAVRCYFFRLDSLTEWQSFQKYIWEEILAPLFEQDERYQ